MYNSYFGNNQYGNQFYPNYQQQGYGTYPAQRQTQLQRTTQGEEMPFNDVRFVNTAEAEGYIMFPNTKVMLIDKDKSIFYIKSADSLGKSTLEGFKYTKLENNPTEVVSPQIDTKDFVKMADLKNFLTKEDMDNFVTMDDMKKFITREEFNNMFRRDMTNGNQ